MERENKTEKIDKIEKIEKNRADEVTIDEELILQKHYLSGELSREEYQKGIQELTAQRDEKFRQLGILAE